MSVSTGKIINDNLSVGDELQRRLVVFVGQPKLFSLSLLPRPYMTPTCEKAQRQDAGQKNLQDVSAALYQIRK